MNNRRFGRSMAMLEGDSQGAVGQRFSMVILRASILSTRFSSSRLLKTYPVPSATANSGKKPDAIIYDPATSRVFAFNGSSAEVDGARHLAVRSFDHGRAISATRSFNQNPPLRVPA